MSEAKGISQGAKVKKHGLRASHTADVYLDDCRIPAGNVLGGKEKLDERLARVREGVRANTQAAMQTFEATRPVVGSQALGIARAAYEYALEYAKEREQFGRQIIENQAIAFTLARMKTELDAARLLVWRASWMGKNGVPFENAEGSMSKLKAGEVAVGSPSGRSRSLAATAIRASTPSSAGTATPRSTTSSRAPRDPAARDRPRDQRTADQIAASAGRRLWLATQSRIVSRPVRERPTSVRGRQPAAAVR